MAKDSRIRCVNVKTGNVRYLVPAVANSPTRLKNLGFMKAELETPPAKNQTELVVEEIEEQTPVEINSSEQN